MRGAEGPIFLYLISLNEKRIDPDFYSQYKTPHSAATTRFSKQNFCGAFPFPCFTV